MGHAVVVVFKKATAWMTIWWFVLCLCATVGYSWNGGCVLPGTTRTTQQRATTTALGMTNDLLPKQQQQQSPQQLGSFQSLVVSDRRHRKVLLEDWTCRRRPTTTTNDPNESWLVDFTTAWNVQRDYLQQHLDRLDRSIPATLSSSGAAAAAHVVDTDAAFYRNQDDDTSPVLSGVDRILLVEHQPVYTLGTASDASLILANNKDNNNNDDDDESNSSNNNNNQNMIPIVRMDRGGQVTYHGPGQLTIYPVIDLRHYQQDIHWYVRALEEVVLVAMEICFHQHGCGRPGIYATRQDDLTGVWLVQKRGQPPQPPASHEKKNTDSNNEKDTDDAAVVVLGKLAAVGVKCRRWITQHGVAINVEKHSVQPFAGIVPCGLTGPHAVVACVNDVVQRPVSVQQMACYIKQGLEQVLAIELVELQEQQEQQQQQSQVMNQSLNPSVRSI